MGVEMLRSEITELQNELNQLVKIYGGELTNDSIIQVSNKLDHLIAQYITITMDHCK